jgi:hypothetical protein
MVSLSFSRRRPAGFFDLKLPGAFLRLLRKPEPLEQAREGQVPSHIGGKAQDGIFERRVRTISGILDSSAASATPAVASGPVLPQNLLEQGLRADFLLQERGLDSFIGRHPVFPGPQELRRPVVNAAAEQQSDAPLSP